MLYNKSRLIKILNKGYNNLTEKDCKVFFRFTQRYENRMSEDTKKTLIEVKDLMAYKYKLITGKEL
tara:strand:+ start:1659 stop:1856 length:198 start_codon:yes stop_codon:yes gene_type:complete